MLSGFPYIIPPLLFSACHKDNNEDSQTEHSSTWDVTETCSEMGLAGDGSIFHVLVSPESDWDENSPFEANAEGVVAVVAYQRDIDVNPVYRNDISVKLGIEASDPELWNGDTNALWVVGTLFAREFEFEDGAALFLHSTWCTDGTFVGAMNCSFVGEGLIIALRADDPTDVYGLTLSGYLYNGYSEDFSSYGDFLTFMEANASAEKPTRNGYMGSVTFERYD